VLASKYIHATIKYHIMIVQMYSDNMEDCSKIIFSFNMTINSMSALDLQTNLSQCYARTVFKLDLFVYLYLYL